MAQNLVQEITTIWAIGRNYSDHAKEMGADTPTSPVVFIKSPAAISTGESFSLPTWSKDVHHELELAVLVGKNNTPTHVALALDLTARDVQSQLKEKKLPWSLAKSFSQSCPLSPFVEYKSDDWFNKLTFELAVNHTIRQFGDAQKMIFSISEIITYLQKHFPLRPGDLILTGTPEGVGPLQAGDELEAELVGELKMSWKVS